VKINRNVGGEVVRMVLEHLMSQGDRVTILPNVLSVLAMLQM
jgi:hypothetical protein